MCSSFKTIDVGYGLKCLNDEPKGFFLTKRLLEVMCFISPLKLKDIK